MSEYDLRSYGSMQADEVRMAAYEAALRATVRPGAVVLDLGTGAGIMALLAARLGASRVVAVDTTPVIEIGRRCAEACGLADRIEFVRGDSRELQLPGGADVIVADLRGVLPLLHDNLAVLADARRRLLAPGGVLIPLRDAIWAAPVHAPEEYDRLERPWRVPGLDQAPARAAVLDEWARAADRMDGLLATPAMVASIEHASGDDPRVRGTADWVIEKDATAHGIAAWFHTELVPGIGYSTGPMDRPTVYGQAFFPWPEPVQLAVGDRVQVEMSAHYPGREVVWVWRTTIERRNAPPLRFRQPTNLAVLRTAASLRSRDAAHVPGLGERGRAARTVLDAAGRGESLAQIADRLATEFPALFSRRAEALNFAAELMDGYGA